MRISAKDEGKSGWLLGIIFTALVVRIACFFIYHAHSGIQTFEYESVAENLIQGKGFMFEALHTVYRAGVAPLFPGLCALIYTLFGHHHALIILLQIALNTMTCVLVFFLAARFCDRPCAYFAATLVALHPGLIIYSSTVLHSLTFYSFFVCSSVLLLVVCSRDGRLRRSVLLGISTGLCVLERPTFLPFFVLAWFWLFFYAQNKKEAKRTILISVVSLLLILSPWTIRNAAVFHRFVFIQTNQWWGFWLGNNPQSTGTTTVSSGIAGVDASPREFQEKLFALDEIGQMELFKAESFDFIRTHPGQAALLDLKKFTYFWWFTPSAGLHYPATYKKLYTAYYSVILLGSLIGIILMLRSKLVRPLVILLLLLFFSNSLLHSLYYVDGRHRWSIEPLLLICFSFGVFQLLTQLRHFSQAHRSNEKG